jgi:hypothetical protein
MKLEIIIRQICHVSYAVINATPASLKHIYIDINSLYKANQNALSSRLFTFSGQSCLTMCFQ